MTNKCKQNFTTNKCKQNFRVIIEREKDIYCPKKKKREREKDITRSVEHIAMAICMFWITFKHLKVMVLFYSTPDIEGKQIRGKSGCPPRPVITKLEWRLCLSVLSIWFA